jgi:hypothetical protein
MTEKATESYEAMITSETESALTEFTIPIEFFRFLNPKESLNTLMANGHKTCKIRSYL